RPAARCGHRDLRAGHLPLACLAPQLRHRLVQLEVAVEPAGRQLPPGRVDRKRSVERDATTTFDELAALARAAEAKRLEPHQGEEAEAVVQLGHLDVTRLQVRA